MLTLAITCIVNCLSSVDESANCGYDDTFPNIKLALIYSNVHMYMESQNYKNKTL